MSDMQIINLDPDDDLSRVTERLEAATTQRVMLIVPPQTHMRSNVLWRLLFQRAQAMGRDVTVVSADRQVRSVAKIAGFRTDDVPDSSSSGKGQTGFGGRTIRSQLEGRLAQQSRTRTPPRKSGSLSRSQPAPRFNTPPERASRQSWSEDESAPSSISETYTGQGSTQASRNIPPPEVEEVQYDRPFEFRIGSAEAVPLSPLTSSRGDEQEMDDPYKPDYAISHDILQSWQSGQGGQGGQAAATAAPAPLEEEAEGEKTVEFPLSTPRIEPESSVPVHGSAFPSQHIQPPDPFDVFDDRLPSPLPEQHASAFVHEVDHEMADLTERPDEVASEPVVEYLGEDETSVPQGEKQWTDILGEEPEEYEPRRVYGSRPRSSRSGTIARRSQRNFYDDDEELAPIDQRPTGPTIMPAPSVAPAPQPPLRPASEQPAARASTGALAKRTPTYPSSAAPPDQIGRPAAPAAARPIQRPPAKPRQSGRGGRVIAAVLIVLLLLFLVGVGLFYYGTSATITITVLPQRLEQSHITLTASTHPDAKAQNVIASQELSFNASATGAVPATGQAAQGGSTASGIATFTNNGAAQVDIPTSTVISTTAGPGTPGILFVTLSDTVVPPHSTYPIQIQAQNPGTSGNVGAGKITVIPADSLTAIAAYNQVSASSLVLSVTNAAPTSGGGVKNVPAVTSNDLAALKLKLHQQIQSQFKAWLKMQLQANDQAGTPVPNVLASANPLAQELLSQAPAAGQPLSGANPTVKGTLSVQITVLVARATAIQAGAQQYLDHLARQKNPPYTITTVKAPVSISSVAGSGSKDGTKLTITLNAIGQIVPYVDLGELSTLLAGKTVDQAKTSIDGGDANIKNVQNVTFDISPGFLNLLPYRPEHIHIVILPGTELK